MRAALAVLTSAVLAVPALAGFADTAAAGATVPARVGITTASTAIGASGLYQPVTPVRVLDSRTEGRVATGGTTHIRVTGVGEVPAVDVVAVSVNVTVLKPRRAGSASVFADGTSWSGATMSFQSGPSQQNFETVPVGASGKIDIRNNSAGLLALIVDVLGYYTSARTQASGRYQPTSPTRVLDTRPGQPVGAGQSRSVQVAGRAGIPPDAAVAVVNFTVLTPSRSGSLSVWDAGGTPATPSLSFAAGRTEQSELNMGLADGALSIRNNSPSAVQVIADVVGYYTLVANQSVNYFFGWGGYARSYDSRAAGVGPVPAGRTVQIPVQLTLADLWGPPLFQEGIAAVSMNVTVLNPSMSQSISVWSGGTAWNGAATISFTAGQTIQRMLLSEAGSSANQPETVQIRNNSLAPIILIVDLNGWAVPSS